MNRLKELRTEKELTQQELADLVEVTKLTIANWENEKHKIKSDKAQQLADYFGVEVGYLLGYSDYASTNNFLESLPEQTFDADVYNAIDSIGEKNLPIVYKFLESQFLEEYKQVTEFPPGYSLQESVTIAMANVSTNLWGLPDNIVKLILYWGVLNSEERSNFFNLIKIAAEKNLTTKD